EWILYLVGIVGSPLLLGVVQQTNLWAERYFLVSATLLLLLAARVLAWATTRGAAARVAACGLLVAFVVANGTRVAWLLRDGRGSYREAIAYMVRHTAADEVSVASDHDFRNRLVVEYFGPRVAGSKTVRYVRAEQTGTPGPEWYVAHRGLGDAPP